MTPASLRPIVIDARAAARARIGGVERWAIEMAARLPARRPGAYVVARPPRALAHRAGHAWEQLWLPAAAAARRTGLVFAPANLAPVLWPRSVVVVHDVAALRHPEWYSSAYVAWQRWVLPRLARRALHLITVSEFSRREIVEELDVDPDRVSVVPGGVDGRFAAMQDPAAVRRRLGLPEAYVLTLGTDNLRKNRAALSAAAHQLQEQGIALVAAGAGRSYMRPQPAADGLVDVGYVRDEDLPGLYRAARAFVLPSRDEGFGLPCLEAMAAGTPVVAAASGGVPEACGDAALLVDPDDQDAIAHAVVAAATAPDLRERLRAAGRRRAAQLTWDRTAEMVDALLATVLAGRGR